MLLTSTDDVWIGMEWGEDCCSRLLRERGDGGEDGGAGHRVMPTCSLNLTRAIRSHAVKLALGCLTSL